MIKIRLYQKTFIHICKKFLNFAYSKGWYPPVKMWSNCIITTKTVMSIHWCIVCTTDCVRLVQLAKIDKIKFQKSVSKAISSLKKWNTMMINFTCTRLQLFGIQRYGEETCVKILNNLFEFQEYHWTVHPLQIIWVMRGLKGTHTGRILTRWV